MDAQQQFMDDVMKMTSNVLKKCYQEKNDCICTVRYRYLKDRHNLPEKKKHMMEVFCDKKVVNFTTKQVKS